MRVAFYAPLKSPDHPVPSGDRRVARLLMAALERAGHTVDLACRLRTWDGAGDPTRQTRLARVGRRGAERLLRRYQADPASRPDAWLTYHLYYKAPDWVGPRVSAALGVPYLVAEASLANKRADGPWAAGHRATLEALRQARAVIGLNPADVPALPEPDKVHILPPFLDAAPYRAAAARRDSLRAQLAGAEDLDPSRPWLLTVAMMRPGDKLASYRLLAEALRAVEGRDWHLLVVGDGPARAEVEAALAGPAQDRVRFLGRRETDDLPALYAACDLLVWPAIGEAYGMALLEAQAAGLPVLAGASGGVPAIVRHGGTGILTPPGDSAAFAAALASLLDAPDRLRELGTAALARTAAEHGIDAAARRLDGLLRSVTGP